MIRELFGDALIIQFTDQDAIEAGILIPFITRSGDTQHRITTNAFHELSHYHREHGYPKYTDPDFYRFYFNELLPLIPYAFREWNRSEILKTDYEFKVGKYDSSGQEVLWYIPNEIGGVTLMLPSDY